MKSFKDAQGREWHVKVDVGQISKTRDRVKVDLYGLFTDEAKRLFSDPVLLVNTLYVLCEQQCSERKMSDFDFGQLFEGQVLESAADALLEAVLSFFPPSRQTILRATVEKSKALAGPAQEMILKKINDLSVMDLLKPTASPAS